MRTRYHTTFTCWQVKEEELTRFEEENGIETRWTPDSKAYKEASVLLVERQYRCAVDHLERLVVQRLFELTKLGMNSIGQYLILFSFCVIEYPYRIQVTRKDQ